MTQMMRQDVTGFFADQALLSLKNITKAFLFLCQILKQSLLFQIHIRT